MYIYMGHMRYEHTKPYEDWFWEKNKIELIRDHVMSLHIGEKVLYLTFGKQLHYDILIIATGSTPNKFDWPGQDLAGVQGFYSIQDLALLERNTEGIKKAVLVGGGLIGVEMAEMLLSRNIDVTMLIRESAFFSGVLPHQDAMLIGRHMASHGVGLCFNTELKEIQTSNDNRVSRVINNRGDTIDCQFVGLTAGVSPSIKFLENSGIATNRGVLVDQYLQSNIPDVYAIGDCAEKVSDLPGRKRIEQVWYTGRMMGEVVAQTICGKPTRYEPGPWFNSAKFFDIEYQTYGKVRPELQADEEELYWEHVSGKKAVHFIWNKKTKEFIGVNVYGIRLRHEMFDFWLRQRKSIHYVFEHLEEANFDPEFFKRHEAEVRSEFEAALT